MGQYQQYILEHKMFMTATLEDVAPHSMKRYDYVLSWLARGIVPVQMYEGFSP